ncbi:MAG: hypothetical protein ACE5MG_06725 [Candidatus Methylomirabilales bacterium]
MVEGSAPAHQLSNLDVGFSWMMLTGFSLENLVKGVLLKRQPHLAKRGRVPSWPGRGHDILTMFRSAGISLRPPEEDLLTRLREFVTWRGRYPIAKTPDEMMPREAVHGGGTPFMMPKQDRQMAEDLFSRLAQVLEKEAQQRMEQ